MKLFRYAYYTVLCVFNLFNHNEGVQRNAVGFFIFIQILLIIPVCDILYTFILENYNSLFRFNLIVGFLILAFNFYYFVKKDRASHKEYDNFKWKEKKIVIVIFLLLLTGSLVLFVKTASYIREKTLDQKYLIYNED